MTKPIAFDGIFGYREFAQFLNVVNHVPPGSSLEVDLYNVGFAHPNGMAPLVATIDDLTKKGWHFDVVLPEDQLLDSYFEIVGWIAGIEGSATPALRRGKSYTPLSPYESHEELNPLVNQIVDHLAETTVFESGVLDAMAWSLNEIADNVLLHAGEGVRGWIQMVEQPKKHLLEMVIVDRGCGIPTSLRQAFPDLHDDREALGRAIEKGVTRDPEIGQGNGLAGTIRIASAAGGWANIHSGSGLLRVMPDRQFFQQTEHFSGTLVEITLPTDRPIDVAEALWGFEPMHELEMDYLQDGGTEILVRVADEASGFGNRASARPIRTKLRNLLVQFPTEQLVLDFDGATLISASFADELVGRLVKEVGPTHFYSRVRLVGLSDLARRTIDAVVAQRLAEGI
jgi:anti-sigma regulatory factor (Ser/Thr protein kinase)